VPSYDLTTAICGLVYGWMMFILFYIGAVLGADLTFIIFRKFSQGYAHCLTVENWNVAAVVSVVERKGFKVACLADALVAVSYSPCAVSLQPDECDSGRFQSQVHGFPLRHDAYDP
jgi:uncharacterized membrane protein YdjX (TVP38/TMEM64 family)